MVDETAHNDVSSKPPLLWRYYPLVYDLGVLPLVPYRELISAITGVVRHHYDGFQATATTPYRLLDACCGTGNVSAAVLRACPKVDVTGIDFADGMIRRAQRKCERLGQGRWLQSEILPALAHLEPGSMDGAVMCNGLYPLEDRCEVLQAIARALRPGGLFVLTDPAAGAVLRSLLVHHLRHGGLSAVASLPLLVASGVFSMLIAQQARHQFLATSEVRRMLTEAGLTVAVEQPAYAGVNYFFAAHKAESTSA